MKFLLSSALLLCAFHPPPSVAQAAQSAATKSVNVSSGSGATQSSAAAQPPAAGAQTSVPVSDLTDALSSFGINYGSFTETNTWGAATGSSNLLTFTDSPNNTGTGYLATFGTAPNSNELPFQVLYRGRKL